MAKCEQLRQDEADAQIVAKAIRATEATRKAHAAMAAINACAQRGVYSDGSCDDVRGGHDDEQPRDPPKTVAALALPPTPVRALLKLSKSPLNPAPSPTTPPRLDGNTVAVG